MPATTARPAIVFQCPAFEKLDWWHNRPDYFEADFMGLLTLSVRRYCDEDDDGDEIPGTSYYGVSCSPQAGIAGFATRWVKDPPEAKTEDEAKRVAWEWACGVMEGVVLGMGGFAREEVG